MAVDGEVVAGTAAWGRNHGGGAAQIATASFMVDPDHGGRGVGRTLGEHVLHAARDAGFRGIQFNAVAETNTAAVRLWRSLGMEVIATFPEGFAHPVHGFVGLHIMYRPLYGAQRHEPAGGAARRHQDALVLGGWLGDDSGTRQRAPIPPAAGPLLHSPTG